MLPIHTHRRRHFVIMVHNHRDGDRLRCFWFKDIRLRARWSCPSLPNTGSFLQRITVPLEQGGDSICYHSTPSFLGYPKLLWFKVPTANFSVLGYGKPRPSHLMHPLCPKTCIFWERVETNCTVVTAWSRTKWYTAVLLWAIYSFEIFKTVFTNTHVDRWQMTGSSGTDACYVTRRHTGSRAAEFRRMRKFVILLVHVAYSLLSILDLVNSRCFP